MIDQFWITCTIVSLCCGSLAFGDELTFPGETIAFVRIANLQSSIDGNDLASSILKSSFPELKKSIFAEEGSPDNPFSEVALFLLPRKEQMGLEVVFSAASIKSKAELSELLRELREVYFNKYSLEKSEHSSFDVFELEKFGLAFAVADQKFMIARNVDVMKGVLDAVAGARLPEKNRRFRMCQKLLPEDADKSSTEVFVDLFKLERNTGLIESIVNEKVDLLCLDEGVAFYGRAFWNENSEFETLVFDSTLLVTVPRKGIWKSFSTLGNETDVKLGMTIPANSAFLWIGARTKEFVDSVGDWLDEFFEIRKIFRVDGRRLVRSYLKVDESSYDSSTKGQFFGLIEFSGDIAKQVQGVRLGSQFESQLELLKKNFVKSGANVEEDGVGFRTKINARNFTIDFAASKIGDWLVSGERNLLMSLSKSFDESKDDENMGIASILEERQIPPEEVGVVFKWKPSRELLLKSFRSFFPRYQVDLNRTVNAIRASAGKNGSNRMMKGRERELAAFNRFLKLFESGGPELNVIVANNKKHIRVLATIRFAKAVEDGISSD